MPRPGEDRSDVGGAAQFNNIGPVPLSSRFLLRPAFCFPSRFLLPQVPKKAATSAFVKSRGCRLPWNKMNRVVQSTEISSRLLPAPKGVGSRREEISVAPEVPPMPAPFRAVEGAVAGSRRHGLSRLGKRSFAELT